LLCSSWETEIDAAATDHVEDKSLSFARAHFARNIWNCYGAAA
jgi:hypothetical protein